VEQELERVPPVSEEQIRSHLPLGTIFAYGLPTAAIGFISIVFSLYLMKFATDVLLIAPGVMGVIYGLGRIWDAISDPLAGYLSDRSLAARGRRRSWMFASAFPIGLGIVLLWSPWPSLGPVGLVAWMALALFLYETANTAYLIPHGALGVELTANYHERTRLFGYRHVLMAAGMILGVGGFELLRSAEEQRRVAFLGSLLIGAVTAALIFYTTARLPERADYRGRGAQRLGKAFADVFRNPHARLILIVFGIETFGASSLAILATYVMEYVIEAPELTAYFILLYFVPQFALTPVWIALSRRFGKKQLWVFSMALLTVGYSGLFFIRELGTDLLYVIGPVLGIGGGCGQVVAPSIKADVVDYDEYLTGERKEGAYLAVWNFVRKAAAGVSAMMTGFVLQIVGFEPNVEQTEATKLAMMALFGLAPGVAYLIGTLLFLRFSFNEQEHARVTAVLESRRLGGGTAARPGPP
jgi:GPH family glycoside/pentoside/hexuronide:cation symporter